MVKRVKAHGVPFDLLACDALYGRDGQFRADVDAEGVLYAAQVPADTNVYVSKPQVGVPEPYRGELPFCVETYLHFIYQYDAGTLRDVSLEALAEFFLDYLLHRKVGHGATARSTRNRRSALPPLLPLFS